MKDCPFNCSDETLVNAFLADTRQKLKKKTIILGKLVIAWCVTVFFGALLFLYIEQCARPTLKPLNDVEIAWKKTCHLMSSLPNSNQIKTNMLTNPPPDGSNSTITINKNDSLYITASTIQEEILHMCNKTKVVEDVRRCVLDIENIADYLDYTYSIAFTIGRLS